MFSRTDTVTDSERFYGSILELLGDPDEVQEVEDLLTWWNRYGITADILYYHRLIFGQSGLFKLLIRETSNH